MYICQIVDTALPVETGHVLEQAITELNRSVQDYNTKINNNKIIKLDDQCMEDVENVFALEEK